MLKILINEIEKKEAENGEIEEKEIRDLNLFFGFIIVLSSIIIFISFFMAVNVDTQIIIFSFNLFLIGVAFTGIGVPDKEQGVAAANVEIWWGVITTIAGLTCFFISLISSNFFIEILFIINGVFFFAGLTAIFAPVAERETRTWSKYAMIVSGLIMLGVSLIYFVTPIFELLGIITITNIKAFDNIMNILLSISICFHGVARIIMYLTGIYTKEENL